MAVSDTSITKSYVDAAVAGVDLSTLMPKSGGTFTGGIVGTTADFSGEVEAGVLTTGTHEAYESGGSLRLYKDGLGDYLIIDGTTGGVTARLVTLDDPTYNPVRHRLTANNTETIDDGASGAANLAVTGSLTAGNAKAKTWSQSSDYVIFGHKDFDTATGYALLQKSNGDTYLNAASTLLLGTAGNGDVALGGGKLRVGRPLPTDTGETLIVGGSGRVNGTLRAVGTASIDTRLRINDPNNVDTIYYDIARSASTGYLNFTGTQTGAIGYTFDTRMLVGSVTDDTTSAFQVGGAGRFTGNLTAGGATFYDSTATTGSTLVTVRAGATQATSGAIQRWVRNSDGSTANSACVQIEASGTQMLIRSPFFQTPNTEVHISATGVRLGQTAYIGLVNNDSAFVSPDWRLQHTAANTATISSDGSTGAANLVVTQDVTATRSVISASYFTKNTYNSDTVLNQYGLTLQTGAQINWRSGAAGATDVALGRNAAGVVEFNNGTAGTYRDLKLRALEATTTISPGTYTVATLPTAGTARRMAYASDGRKNGEGAAAGTGVLVFDDGVAWRAVDTGATVAA